MALDRHAVALLGVGFSRELVAFDGLLPADGGEAGEDVFILPTSIVESALGTPRLDLVVHGEGFSDSALGSPRIDLTVLPTAFTGTAFGTPRVDLAVLPNGFESALFGEPRLDLTVHPPGAASSEAFGTPTVIAGQAIFPIGIPSGESFGAPRIDIVVLPEGVNDSAVGKPALGIPLYPPSIPSGEALGTPRIDLTVSPSSWQESSFGALRLDQVVFSGSVSSGETFGSARVDHQLFAGPGPSDDAGQPIIAVAIHPKGIGSGFAAGIPRLDQVIFVPSTHYGTTVGVPTVRTDKPYHRLFQPRPPQFNAWRPISPPPAGHKDISIRYGGDEGPAIIVAEVLEREPEVPIALADISAPPSRNVVGRASSQEEEKKEDVPITIASPSRAAPGGSIRVTRTPPKTSSLPSGSGKSKKPT